MKLQEAQRLARTLMEQHGIGDWSFNFNNAVRSAGQCHARRKRIVLSRPLTQARPDEAIQDTILHEIAHALTPGHHHNHVWKSKAISIGCNGKRCYEGDFIKAKFKGTCPSCNRVVEKHRRTKSACGRCCNSKNQGKFSPDFLLAWAENV